MTDDWIRVRNWEKWQSYRSDRGQPPWIKVHRRLAQDPSWVALTDAQRGQLVCMWILAADRDGKLPSDRRLIARMCLLETEPDLEVFVSLGFIEPDANVTPKRRQPDTLTRSREAEAEKEAVQNSPPTAASSARAHASNGTSSSDPFAGLEDLARKSVIGLYGDGTSEGTDERVWGELHNPVARKTALMIAVSRWRGEGHARFNSRLFRRILETVIAEQAEPERSGLWG